MELNRTLYRRLVQLYLISFVLLCLAAGQILISADLRAFDDEFTELTRRYFGSSAMSDAMAIALGVLLIAHIAAAIGLLWFKPWARLLFWITLLLVYGESFVSDSPVLYDTSLLFVLDSLGLVLVGAILLLSYSRDYGAIWFAGLPLTTTDMEEKNG